jgi:hypothetical protein
MFRFIKENNQLVEIEDKIFNLETLYVDCECNTADHVFRFAYVLDNSNKYIDDDLYLECVLCYDGFLYRLKTALLYIFNYHNIRRWNTILISHNDAKKIKELCELYLRSNDEIKKVVSKSV